MEAVFGAMILTLCFVSMLMGVVVLIWLTIELVRSK